MKLTPIFALLLLTVGCTGKVDQTALLAGANRGLTIAENTASDFRAAGWIGDTDWKHTQEVAVLLQGYLDTWQSNLGKAAGDVAMNAFFSNLPQLLQIIKDFSPARKTAATRPVTHVSSRNRGAYYLPAYNTSGRHRGDPETLVAHAKGPWLRAG